MDRHSVMPLSKV